MKLTIGFSPCPNDTFIFDALVNDKIDKGDIEFEVYLEDVQTLNEWSLSGKLDITKVSYGVWPLIKQNYELLDAGSALGMGVGPLLISNKPLAEEKITDSEVLIPGQHTTAHMLFTHAFPFARNKRFVRYDEVENELVTAGGKDVAGVIIHENRFTYEDKGLILIKDLGRHWEEQTNSPIPLGGIVAKRSIDTEKINTLNDLIRRSIEYAWVYYPHLSGYIRSHAQEMSENVMRKHINLYVNDYSISLGAAGRNAVETFEKIFSSTSSLKTGHETS
jgi:1,4-dihydroxy-6-naphthoate synthase